MRALVPAVLALLCSCGTAPTAGNAFGSLRGGLDDASAAKRAESAFRLGQLGVFDGETPKQASAREAAFHALIPAASDPEPAVRRAAVEALGKTGGPDAEDVLLAAATDADAGVRGEAALALFRRRFLKRVPEYSSAAFAALDMLAADPDAEVRWRAAYAFTRFADERAKETLVKTEKDPDWRARLFAVRALGKLGARPDSSLFGDPQLYVRAEAVAACGLSKGCEPPAMSFVDPSPHVRAAAADYVAASGRADLAPRIEKLADGDSPLPRGRALLALAKLRGDAEAGRLARARRDSDWWVRSKAYEASAGLTGGAEILREGTKDADYKAASAALEALGASSATFVDAVLAGVLEDPRAPLEMTGTAADAAAERKSVALVEPMLGALRRAGAETPAEVRDGLRKAIEATAGVVADKKAAAVWFKALKAIPPVKDEPKVFPPLANSPTLVLETMKGRVELLLDASAAPNHAAAIAAMARKGLYDGSSFHRVVTAFVVQGGDPRGSGWGDAGYRLADEAGPGHFERGTLGMPKAGPDTGGCQLFVSLVPTPHLDGRYTAFGKVLSGMEVLDELEPGDKILKGFLK